jgi:hypothetical protein
MTGTRIHAVGLLVALAFGWPSLSPAAPWPFHREDPPKKPEKIVAVWSATVLYPPGQPATRGFGGRLMFYEAKNDKSIKVEGTLVVYAFDEEAGSAKHAKPDRKYVVTAAQLPTHYSKSPLGHSYSIWLPWDPVGGCRKEVSLIVRFEPKEGPAVVGQPLRELLPGTPAPQAGPGGPPNAPPPAMAAVRGPSPLAPGMPTAQPGVQPASYQEPLSPAIGPGGYPGENDALRRMSTTTIPVPTGLIMRPATAAPAAWQNPQAAWQNPQASRGPYGPPAISQPAPAADPAGRPGRSMTWAPDQWAGPPDSVRAGSPLPPATLQTGQGERASPLGPPAGAPPASPPPTNSQWWTLPPQSRSSPGQSHPLGEPIVQLTRDRAPWQLRPAESPSSPPAAPGAASGPGWPPPATAAPPSPY